MLFWYWIAFWSVVTFCAYGWDKLQAKRDAWRVPEKTLHALALVGGFVGGWVGMFLFRHKTRKPVFKVILAASTVIWVAIWILLVLR